MPQFRPPEYPTHNGAPAHPLAVVFGDPGVAIGRILSVSSLLSRHGGTVASTVGYWFSTLVLSAIAGIMGAFGGLVAALWLTGIARSSSLPRAVVGEIRVWVMLLPLIAGVALFVLVIRGREPPLVECTFVGSEGMARFTKRKRGGERAEIVRFCDVPFLDAAEARVISERRGEYTAFAYIWQSAQRIVRFSISGSYPRYRGLGQSSALESWHAVHFGRAAASAHTAAWKRLLEWQLATHGVAQFPAWWGGVTLSPRRLEVHGPRGGFVVRPEEVSRIERLRDGLLLVGASGWQQKIETANLRDDRVEKMLAAPDVLCAMLPRCGFAVDAYAGGVWAA